MPPDRQTIIRSLTEQLSQGSFLFDNDHAVRAHQGFIGFVGGVRNFLAQLPDSARLVAEWLALPGSPLGPFQGESIVTSELWQIYISALQHRLDWLSRLIGSMTESKTMSTTASTAPADQSAVFVVHGRDEVQRKAMFEFLRSLGLHPLEFSEARAATGKATPYVGEILDAAFKMAQAVVVLVAGDDEACLRKDLRQPNDPVHETRLTPQARPNVLFEAGMAMGRDPDRTIIVEIGVLRPFSDIGGRHTLRFDGSTQRRQELADRLETAGCPVNKKGIEWHTAGTFVVTAGTTPPTLSAPIVEPQVELSHQHHDLLRVIAGQRRVSAEDLAGGMQRNQVAIEHDLDELRRRKLVAQVATTSVEPVFSLTEGGRAYVVAHRLDESRV